MRELIDKYDSACTTKTSTYFRIRDFQSTKLPILNKDEFFVIETLLAFEKSKGFIKIEGDIVTLTQQGLDYAKLSREDWD